MKNQKKIIKKTEQSREAVRTAREDKNKMKKYIEKEKQQIAKEWNMKVKDIDWDFVEKQK